MSLPVWFQRIGLPVPKAAGPVSVGICVAMFDAALVLAAVSIAAVVVISPAPPAILMEAQPCAGVGTVSNAIGPTPLEPTDSGVTCATALSAASASVAVIARSDRLRS